jgi:hypothetical protein
LAGSWRKMQNLTLSREEYKLKLGRVENKDTVYLSNNSKLDLTLLRL